MFHNTYQAGFLSILYSIGSKPLQIWDSKVQNGYIQRITDEDIQSSVLEVVGTNVSTNYIHCPGDPKKTLGIRLPYLVLILKNLDKYFTFEVQVLDDKNIRRRFRASTFQSCTRVKPFICTMPMSLDEGWNQIQFNLADFTRRAYGTNYVETLRVQVHANCRLRRIYFSDRLYSEEELPPSFNVFLPVRNQHQHKPPHHHAMATAAAREPKMHERSGGARPSRKPEAASVGAAEAGAATLVTLGNEKFEQEQGKQGEEEEEEAMGVTEAMAAALITGEAAVAALAAQEVGEGGPTMTIAAAEEKEEEEEEDSGAPVVARAASVDKGGRGSPAEGEAPVGAS